MSTRARIRQKWIVPVIVVLVIAPIGTARDAAPQERQNATQKQEQTQPELEQGPFGISVDELRKRGLDVVLVIDRTGSMKLIIDDIKAQMGQLVQAIHRLVPIARVGIIAFGGKDEKMNILPLTLSSDEMIESLNDVQSRVDGEWEDDTIGAVETAINKMDWKRSAKKVVILVGDSPPRPEDFPPLFALIRKFKDNDGTFNAIDVADQEHERFEREFWLKHHREEPPKISPLPEFYRQTAAAYRVLTATGDGNMWELSHDVSIDRLIFLLVFPYRPIQAHVLYCGRGHQLYGQSAVKWAATPWALRQP